MMPSTASETSRSGRRFLSIRCVWSLCVSSRHALYVLALHGVVPRLAVCAARVFPRRMFLPRSSRLHGIFQERLQICNSRSMAVGGARPYLRSASVCPSAWRRSSRFCGDTMLSVILLTSVSNVFVQAAETDLVADLGWQKGFQSSPIDRNALRCSRAHRVFVSRVSSFLLPYLFRVSLRLFLHVVRFGTRRFDQPSKVGLASLDVT